MKIYLLVTTLTFVSIATLGYWTGKSASHTAFANACATDGMVVVVDRETDVPRHFHCFELEHPAAPARPEVVTPSHRWKSGQVLHL